MNKFAERFRNALKANHMSQSKFAKDMKMSVSAINDYCTGRREPSLNTLMSICKKLDEKSDYLLGLED